MAEWPHELIIQLERDRAVAAYIILLDVGADFAREMLPEPNLGRSVLGERARRRLIMTELVPPTDEPATCPLRGLHIQGQAIPDMELAVSRAIERVDGSLVSISSETTGSWSSTRARCA